jgi:hypothetical protein
MSNKEYWVGWLKTIALILYCTPEVNFLTRMGFLLFRSAARRPIHAQVPSVMLYCQWCKVLAGLLNLGCAPLSLKVGV